MDEWAVFVKTHPQGNVFQTPEMYESYSKASHNKPITIASYSDGLICGILLAVIITNGGGIIRCFTSRSVIIGGPLAKDNDPLIIDLLFKEYVRVLPCSVIYSEIRPIYDLNIISQSLLQAGFNRVSHYNLVMDIDIDKDAIWRRMHKERRRNVEKANKCGLVFQEIKSDDGIQDIVSLIKQTYHRKRVPLSYSDIFFQINSSMSKYVHFFGAYYQGHMIAGQVRLCYNGLVYAWFAGSDEQYFKLRPNDFLMWNVISWAHDNGYVKFDFGGGGEPGTPYGVRDYKLKYGCEIFDWGRYLCIHKPLLYKVGKTGVRILGLKR